MSRYIDADLLKDKTTRVNNIWNGTTNAEGKGLDEIIDDIPTADVRENVRGEWILHIDDLSPVESTMECNQCHEHQPVTIDDNFCPNCGADMRGES